MLRLSSRSNLLNLFLIAAFCLPGLPLCAQLDGQLDPLNQPAENIPNVLTEPTLSPGVALLMQLEAEFQKAVVAGGGKAFASWFAPDGMTLANGKTPVIGREAIATQATWDPRGYQLTWTPEGGQMGPSGDMGFTWGHYEGRSRDQNGNPVVTTGRYLTIWKKQSDGSWKVSLDASADLPPSGSECCTLPKP
jgi:ketosteroid isomerase-like protein